MTITDQALRRIGWVICGLSILAAPTTLVLVTVAGALDQAFANFSAVDALNSLLYGALGLVLVNAQPRNRLVWFFLMVGFCAAMSGTITGIIELIAADQGVAFEQIDMSGWPPGVRTIVAHVFSLWVIGNFGLPTLGLLLAPDGHLLSRRWLPVALASALVIGFVWVMFAAKWPLRSEDAVNAYTGRPATLISTAFFVLILAILASFGSLVLRYRCADGQTRRRLRWIVAGGALFVAAFFPATLGPEALLAVFYPVLGVSFGLAIWRDQLFDVDVVISRTLLFGFLAAFIGAVYVGVVFGVGALIGRQSSDSQALPLLATVVVAFLFHPVRQRLERTANRLVYGPRATPYEVLSDLSARLARAESTQGLLGRMASLVADGTGAERVIVWRWSDQNYEPVATWPMDQVVTPTATIPVDDVTVPIQRAGDVLGALTVRKPRGELLIPTEQRLLDDLAGSAGLVLDQARLDSALTEQAHALVRSRRRLIGAQDDERHRLERQLKAGTQRQLTRLASQLGASAELANTEGVDALGEQLVSLGSEARLAADEIAMLAQGMYPPVLETAGLTAAVESLADMLPVPVEVRSTLQRRFDLDLELGVYFCIAEALTNVVKHAHATTVSVGLHDNDTILAFDVSDDGSGFDANHCNESSTGLIGLVDRMDAIEGTVEVTSSVGVGTTVSGSVPVRARQLNTTAAGQG